MSLGVEELLTFESMSLQVARIDFLTSFLVIVSLIFLISINSFLGRILYKIFPIFICHCNIKFPYSIRKVIKNIFINIMRRKCYKGKILWYGDVPVKTRVWYLTSFILFLPSNVDKKVFKYVLPLNYICFFLEFILNSLNFFY